MTHKNLLMSQAQVAIKKRKKALQDDQPVLSEAIQTNPHLRLMQKVRGR